MPGLSLWDRQDMDDNMDLPRRAELCPSSLVQADDIGQSGRLHLNCGAVTRKEAPPVDPIGIEAARGVAVEIVVILLRAAIGRRDPSGEATGIPTVTAAKMAGTSAATTTSTLEP